MVPLKNLSYLKNLLLHSISTEEGNNQISIKLSKNKAITLEYNLIDALCLTVIQQLQRDFKNLMRT